MYLNMSSNVDKLCGTPINTFLVLSIIQVGGVEVISCLRQLFSLSLTKYFGYFVLVRFTFGTLKLWLVNAGLISIYMENGHFKKVLIFLFLG